MTTFDQNKQDFANVIEAIELCKPLVKTFEGYAKRLPDGRCMAYLCPSKVWTIGYGSTGPGIMQSTVWTLKQAEAKLESHLWEFCIALMKVSPSLLTEKPQRIAAVLSFVYNVGIGKYKTSTFKKRIDAKNWQGAYSELQKWKFGGGKELKGLALRRLQEGKLLLS